MIIIHQPPTIEIYKNKQVSKSVSDFVCALR